MIIIMRLPDDSIFNLFVANSSSQELETALCKIIGLDTISTYDHAHREVVGFKGGKGFHGIRTNGEWKLYPLPEAR